MPVPEGVITTSEILTPVEVVEDSTNEEETEDDLPKLS